MKTMMGAKEADDVQDGLRVAVAALTRAQGILYPHANTGDVESNETLLHVNKALNEIDKAEECLDL